MVDWLCTCWYMAGWSDEIGDNGLSRRICDEPIYLYRLPSGEPAAMADRCPHRFAPLSLGSRDGDNVVCGYHGLTFSPEGKCVRNPFSERIPSTFKVRTYPAVERHGIVWLWLGSPETADETKIPDFSFIPDTAHSRTVHGYTLMNANYEYGTDNLLDLSHIEFVHKGSIAGQGVIFAGQHSVRVDGDTLHSDWFMPDVPLPSVAYGRYPSETRVDHWLEMRWNAPASMCLMIGACPHGQPRETGFELPQAHILTPASEHESHYFWSSTRYHDLDSLETDAALIEMLGRRQADDRGSVCECAREGFLEAAAAVTWCRQRWRSSTPPDRGDAQGGNRVRRSIPARGKHRGRNVTSRLHRGRPLWVADSGDRFNTLPWRR